MNNQYVVKMSVSDLVQAGVNIPEFDDEGYRHLLLSCSEVEWEDYGDTVDTWIECSYADTMLLQMWAESNLVEVQVELL